MVGLDDAALCGVASLLAPGGRLEVFASIVPSDGVAGMACLDADARDGRPPGLVRGRPSADRLPPGVSGGDHGVGLDLGATPACRSSGCRDPPGLAAEGARSASIDW